MLSEEFITTICGPPLASNTSIQRDVGIHAHTLSPTYSVRATFKKSSTPANCLAVSKTHIFAAQHEKAAYVHVYSRLRGNQEAFVPFPERIRCLALAGDVLVLGTAEGRIMLWEHCTGRLVSTPPCHVQAVTCLATTPYHLLSGSDDSNVHVWSLARLLELGAGGDDSRREHELEPERTLSNHRAGVTALAASSASGAVPESALCVSTSRDKTCVVWNHQTGLSLRTLLFPSAPLCAALDPCTRSLCVSTADDGCVYLIELFGGQHGPLLGPHAAEAASTAVQVSSPFGVAPLGDSAGPATCLALSHDGSVLLSGHPRGRVLRWNLAGNSPPVELANLNAAVTNIAFVSPFEGRHAGGGNEKTESPTVVKPTAQAGGGTYTLSARLDGDIAAPGAPSRFDTLLNTPGFSQEALEEAILAFQQPGGGAAASIGEQELRRQNDELLEIVAEQRKLYKQLLKQCTENDMALS